MNKNFIPNIWLSVVWGGITTFLLLLAACAPQTSEFTVPASSLEQRERQIDGEPVITPSPSVPTVTPEISTRPPRPIPPALETVPTANPKAASITGEVPEPILDSVFQDVEERTGVSREEIKVQTAEAVIWNDGALGCPQPGQMYTQATVEGYLIVLEVDNKVFNYHAAAPGFFILCENSLPLPPLQGTPAS